MFRVPGNICITSNPTCYNHQKNEGCGFPWYIPSNPTIPIKPTHRTEILFDLGAGDLPSPPPPDVGEDGGWMVGQGSVGEEVGLATGYSLKFLPLDWGKGLSKPNSDPFYLGFVFFFFLGDIFYGSSSNKCQVGTK